MQRLHPICRHGRLVWCFLAVVHAAAFFVSSSWVFAQEEEKPKAESSQEALAVFSDAANFQNNGAYELAVSEWETFVKTYPKDPLAPKANHYLGVCRMQLKDYSGAATAFAATTKFPKFSLTEEAYLNLGWCQFKLAEGGKQELFAQSIATLDAQLKMFPVGKGKLADQALFYQAEANYLQGQKKQAVEAYSQLVKQFKQSALRSDAIYALGVTQEELGDYPAAAATYDLFLAESPDSKLKTEVAMRKAETVLQTGLAAEKADDAEAAKAAFTNAEAAFADVVAVENFSLADHATYRQALCVLKLGDYNRAAELYASIPDSFPDSDYAGEAILSAGRSFYRAEKYEQASPWFAKAIAAGKKEAIEAAHWLSRAQLRLGDYAAAAKTAEAAIPQAADSSFLVALKMDVADANYEVPEKRADSMAKYLAIAKEHPESKQAPQALYNGAFGALELGEYDAALQHVADFRTAFPDNRLTPDIDYISAEANLQLAKYDIAEAEYKKLTTEQAKHPELANWLNRYGLTLYLQKKYQPTIDALTAQLAAFQTPTSLAEAKFLIGASHFFLDQFDAAVTALEASLAADAKWRQADETLIVLSRAQRAQDKLADAKQTVERLLASFPKSSLIDQAHYRLGEYSYAGEDYDIASKEYEVVIAEHPKSIYLPFALYGKGWCQLKTKAHAMASETFTQLIDGYAEHQLRPEALYARGMCRRQTNDFAAGVKDLDAFLQTDVKEPQRSNARYEKGLCQVGAKDFTGAVKTFEQLLKDQPKYAAGDKVLYEIGWAQKSQNQTPEATAAFTRLTKSYADSPLAAEAFFHVGEAQYQAKKFAAAATAYAQAQQRVSAGDLAEKVLYKLGWSKFQQQMYEPASADFATLLAKHPQSSLTVDATFMKAESLFKFEQYAEALDGFTSARKVIEAAPKASAVMHVLTLLHGGQAAGQLKKWDQAMAFLQEIPTKFPDSNYVPQALFERGRAHQALGDKAMAMTDFQAAAKDRTAVGAQSQFMIGEIYFGDKVYDKAILQFQRCVYGYGGERAGEAVKKWQAKSAFEAARCYDVQIRDAGEQKAKMIAGATKMYQHIVDKHASDPLAEAARKRLAELAKLSS